MPLAAAATTYGFSGAVGGGDFPACIGGTWSASGNTYTCASGSIALASGDRILPSSSIVVVAQNGGALAGNNTLGSAGAAVTLKSEWGAMALSGGNTAIFGDLATGSGAVSIAGNNNAIHGNLTSANWTNVTAANAVIDGNIAVAGPVALTNVTVKGSVSTTDKLTMTGGSVAGDISAINGVATNGTVVGGDVKLTTSGEISLTGGSVGGAVHSDCCAVTTTNTNVGNGISSNANTVSIDGGTISGLITTAGGGGVVVKNATITDSGFIAVQTSNVPITISNSNVYGSISGNNNVTLADHTTVFGDVTAGNWPDALKIDGTSQVSGNCSPYNARCGVIPIHHVRLTHTGAGVTCVGSNVIVTACYTADVNGVCTTATKGVGGNIVVRNGATTVTTVPFSVPAGASSSNVSVSVNVAQTVAFETSALSPAPSNPSTCWNSTTLTADCSHDYKDAGFVISETPAGPEAAIAPQTAGVGSATYYLRAVKKNPLTNACEAALLGTNAVNFAYECTNPTSCYSSDLMTVNGGTSTTIARNDNGGVSAWSNVSITFDGNGSAPFTLNYVDAGSITLHARKTIGTSTISGASGFVTKPYGIKIDASCNGTANGSNKPTSPAVGDDRFCPAGSPFSVIVTGIANGPSSPITPNYGRETTAQAPTIAWSLALPTGGAPGTVVHPGTFAPTDASTFTGSLTSTGLTWSEVGILKAIATVNYLGAGNVTSTAFVGRFHPHHFHTVPSGQSGCDAFAYSGHGSGLTVVPGQPFNVAVVAKNANGDEESNTTKNYSTTGGFSRDVTLSLPAGTAGKLYRGTTLGGGTVAAGAFTQGVGTVTSGDDTANRISFVFNNYLTIATDIPIHAEDADTGTTTGTDGTLNIRAGRLHLSNAFGSEKRTLTMPVQAQYWSGLTWVVNAADGCTELPNKNVFSFTDPKTDAATTLTGVVNAPLKLGGGKGDLTLSAPGVVGSANIAIDLGNSGGDQSCLNGHGGMAANLPWLRGANGSCPAAAANNSDPSARATFGIYTPENKRVIHVREMF
jgi:MSHA biogenesis protein MshQ